jgi:hypothetical protein
MLQLLPALAKMKKVYHSLVILQGQVRVNGTLVPCRILVDCGASGCFIDSGAQCAHQIKGVKLKAAVPIRLADNSELRATEVSILPLSIGSYREDLKFHSVNTGGQWDLILGKSCNRVRKSFPKRVTTYCSVYNQGAACDQRSHGVQCTGPCDMLTCIWNDPCSPET